MLYTKATQCDGYCTYHLMLLSCFPQEPPRPLLALRLLRLNSSFLIFFLSASIVESFLIYSYYTPVLMKINPVLSQSHSAAVFRIIQYQQQHRCNNSIIPTEKEKMSRKFFCSALDCDAHNMYDCNNNNPQYPTTSILSAATADVFLHKTPDGIILDMVYSNAFPSVVLFLLLLVTMAFLYCGVYRILRFFFIKSMRGGIRLMEKTPDWFAIQIKRKRRKEREKMYRM